MLSRLRKEKNEDPYKVIAYVGYGFYKWAVVHTDGSMEKFETKFGAGLRARALNKHARKNP